jgi:hypothetical protein
VDDRGHPRRLRVLGDKQGDAIANLDTIACVSHFPAQPRSGRSRPEVEEGSLACAGALSGAGHDNCIRVDADHAPLEPVVGHCFNLEIDLPPVDPLAAPVVLSPALSDAGCSPEGTSDVREAKDESRAACG